MGRSTVHDGGVDGRPSIHSGGVHGDASETHGDVIPLNHRLGRCFSDLHLWA